MKSLKALLISCTFLMLISLFFGCRRDRVVSVNGRLIEDCNQIGVANHKLRMSFEKEKSYFSSSKVQSNSNAGSGETDANGNFKFNIIHQSNNGEWTLIDETNNHSYNISMYSISDNKLELGEVFEDSLQYRAKINLSFKNRIEASDTLFYKVNNKTDTLFLNGQKNVQLSFEKAFGYGVPIPYREWEEPFQWGFGQKDFMKKDSIHLVKIKAKTCNFQPYDNNLELFK